MHFCHFGILNIFENVWFHWWSLRFGPAYTLKVEGRAKMCSTIYWRSLDKLWQVDFDQQITGQFFILLQKIFHWGCCHHCCSWFIIMSCTNRTMHRQRPRQIVQCTEGVISCSLVRLVASTIFLCSLDVGNIADQYRGERSSSWVTNSSLVRLVLDTGVAAGDC